MRCRYVVLLYSHGIVVMVQYNLKLLGLQTDQCLGNGRRFSLHESLYAVPEEICLYSKVVKFDAVQFKHYCLSG